VATFFARCREWELTVLDLPTAYWHEVTTRLDVEPVGLPPLVREGAASIVPIESVRTGTALCAPAEAPLDDSAGA
jgi:hypothetical protein